MSLPLALLASSVSLRATRWCIFFMETWIVDWGPESNGSRYALLQASSYEEAELIVDGVGDPTHVLVVPLVLGEEHDLPYLEIAEPDEVWEGKTLAETVTDSVEASEEI